MRTEIIISLTFVPYCAAVTADALRRSVSLVYLLSQEKWYVLRPIYTGDFCRSNSMQLNAIFVASKLQSAAISLRF